MLKKVIKIIGLISLVASYALLIWHFIQNGAIIDFTQSFNLAWIFGVVSLVSNGAYAIVTEVDQIVLSGYGWFGLIWFAPFFIEIDTLYGIPSLIIYLLITIYLQVRKVPE